MKNFKSDFFLKFPVYALLGELVKCKQFGVFYLCMVISKKQRMELMTFWFTELGKPAEIPWCFQLDILNIGIGIADRFQ